MISLGEKEFKVEKQNDKDNQNEKKESNEISIKPNVLLQEKINRNEKVTKFLNGLPQMPSTSCNLKGPLYEEEKNSTTSDDPEDIQPVRSTLCELNYEEDFESCSNDPDAESGVYVLFLTTGIAFQYHVREQYE